MGGMVMDEGGDRRSKIQQIKKRATSNTSLCCVIVFLIILILLIVISIVMGFFIGDKFGPTIKGLFTNDVMQNNGTMETQNGNQGNGTSYPMIYAWSQWSACSKTCGGGMRTRSHLCGGQGCSTDTKPCNNHTCPSTTFCQFMTSLDPNTQTPAVAGITWTSGIVAKSGTCANQGVLHLVPPTGTTKLHVYMHLNNVTGWSFHLGDHVTNNGWGGGSGPDPWVAEIHNGNKGLSAYGNVAWKTIVGPPVPSLQVLKYFPEGEAQMQITVEKINRVRMTLWEVDGSQVVKMRDHHMFKFDDFYLGMNRVVATSGRSGSGEAQMQITVAKTNIITMTLWKPDGSQVVTMRDHYMFKFDDFYLGMNRVVSSTSRSGSGLCSVCIGFE